MGQCLRSLENMSADLVGDPPLEQVLGQASDPLQTCLEPQGTLSLLITTRIMPIQQPFTEYRTASPPNQIGLYELGRPANTETGYGIVYIGSGRLKRRLRDHDRSDKSWFVYRCEITNCTRRARERERAELRKFKQRHGRLPTYNNRIG